MWVRLALVPSSHMTKVVPADVLMHSPTQRIAGFVSRPVRVTRSITSPMAGNGWATGVTMGGKAMLSLSFPVDCSLIGH